MTQSTRDNMVRRWISISALMGLTMAGCSPASMVDVQPPSGVVDPSVVATSAGAAQLASYALNRLSFTYAGTVGNCDGNFSYISGILTDELMWDDGFSIGLFDSRTFNKNMGTGSCGSVLYPIYNQPRVEARQAREALVRYASTTSQAMQGRMAATEGYAILMIAELFCSGLPLSTVTFTGVTTLTPGFTTDELFTAAAALFDTAIVLSADSSRLIMMAKVGKARALLGRGKIADAAQAVQGVPTDFVYQLTYTASPNANYFGGGDRKYFTRDNEGVNGMPWSTDPRAAIMTTPAISSGKPYSAKYFATVAGVLDPTQTVTNNPVWLASGVEARLIEAEADLAAGGTNWLGILNTLRATCIGTAACAPVPGLSAASMSPLTDPGSADARLNLVIKERAMWLFLTGHRQGDLRRLAHFYHRDPETLWPAGVYVNPGFPPLIAASSLSGSGYGKDYVLSPDGATTEESRNPLYTGCFNFDP